MRGHALSNQAKSEIISRILSAPKVCPHCDSRIELIATYRRIAKVNGLSWRTIEKIVRQARRGEL